MKLTGNWLISAVLLLALAGCGGGGSDILPGPDGNDGGDNETPLAGHVDVDIQSRNSLSVVPGEMSVLSGASAEDLQAVVAPLGMDVLHKDGPWATVRTPQGMDVAEAKLLLEKEYIITTAEPVSRISTTRYSYPGMAKGLSWTPLDPMYGDQTVNFFFNNPDVGLTTFAGQAQPMNAMGFNGAWDVTDPVNANNQVAAVPVTIAIIDAGWFDYSTLDRVGLDETRLDAANSGFVDDNGAFTPGLAAATWDLIDDADPETRNLPFRNNGELMLGVLAASHNDVEIRGFDFSGDTNISPDEVWNDGIAGVNPNATYILIKTGEAAGDAWSFTNNHIAESIDHAATAGADIILLGMFAEGAVAGNVSTAIANARDGGALVVAPAGDVIDSFNGTDFDSAPVDISVTSVTPASDPNVVSVAGTGFNRIGALPQVDFGGGPIDNPGNGWTPGFAAPFDDPFGAVAQWSNTGATIAGSGFGIGFSFHPFFVEGDPAEMTMGENYATNIFNFGSTYAAAYVAGAASLVFQTLTFANGGTEPTDEEVLNELTSTVQFSPLDGTQSGLLNANAAMVSSINGGSLFDIVPSLAFQNILASQPFAAITRGTDFELTVTVVNGTAPFEIEVDWGNGEAPEVISNWNNGDPVTLEGGYETLGPKIINVTVRDDDGQEVITGINTDTGINIFVINPLAAGVTIERADDGTAVLPSALQDGVAYRFRANLSNVFTGEIGGVPNTTTLSWDFNEDGTEDATGPSPVFTYLIIENSRNFTVELEVTEDVRPGGVFNIPVTVTRN